MVYIKIFEFNQKALTKVLLISKALEKKNTLFCPFKVYLDFLGIYFKGVILRNFEKEYVYRSISNQDIK